MKRTTKHVALDVHPATLASVREDRGRVIARTFLPTEEGPRPVVTRCAGSAGAARRGVRSARGVPAGE